MAERRRGSKKSRKRHTKRANNWRRIQREQERISQGTGKLEGAGKVTEGFVEVNPNGAMTVRRGGRLGDVSFDIIENKGELLPGDRVKLKVVALGQYEWRVEKVLSRVVKRLPAMVAPSDARTVKSLWPGMEGEYEIDRSGARVGKEGTLATYAIKDTTVLGRRIELGESRRIRHRCELIQGELAIADCVEMGHPFTQGVSNEAKAITQHRAADDSIELLRDPFVVVSEERGTVAEVAVGLGKEMLIAISDPGYGISPETRMGTEAMKRGQHVSTSRIKSNLWPAVIIKECRFVTSNEPSRAIVVGIDRTGSPTRGIERYRIRIVGHMTYTEFTRAVQGAVSHPRAGVLARMEDAVVHHSEDNCRNRGARFANALAKRVDETVTKQLIEGEKSFLAWQGSALRIAKPGRNPARCRAHAPLRRYEDYFSLRCAIEGHELSREELGDLAEHIMGRHEAANVMLRTCARFANDWARGKKERKRW